MTGSKAAASLTGISHLQLIGVIEVDPDGRNHPGVEQRRQDLLSYGIGDEMEMEGVPPVDTYTHGRVEASIYFMQLSQKLQSIL